MMSLDVRNPEECEAVERIGERERGRLIDMDDGIRQTVVTLILISRNLSMLSISLFPIPIENHYPLLG